MRIRPIQIKPAKPADFLIQRLKKCTELVRAYHSARIERRSHEAHAVRLEIAMYTPPGVYVLGGSQKHFAVYGTILHPSKKLVSPERLFVVPVIPLKEARKTLEIDDDGTFSKWTIPLVDTEGFLTPIFSDGYHGERYIRVGEIVT